MLYCFLKYLRECQFFKEIVIFQISDPFFVLFQTARTLLISTLHWKAMLFWKCLYPYFNFKWLFDVATEVKILLWHTYCVIGVLHKVFDWYTIIGAVAIIGSLSRRVSTTEYMHIGIGLDPNAERLQLVCYLDTHANVYGHKYLQKNNPTVTWANRPIWGDIAGIKSCYQRITCPFVEMLVGISSFTSILSYKFLLYRIFGQVYHMVEICISTTGDKSDNSRFGFIKFQGHIWCKAGLIYESNIVKHWSKRSLWYMWPNYTI